MSSRDMPRRITRANRNPDLKGRSWVYFARERGSGLIKIGQSRQVHRRISVLNSACPHGVDLIGLIPETWLHEAKAHGRFARHQANGEWFHPVPELVALAEAGMRVFANGYVHETDDPDLWLLTKGCHPDYPRSAPL